MNSDEAHDSKCRFGSPASLLAGEACCLALLALLWISPLPAWTLILPLLPAAAFGYLFLRCTDGAPGHAGEPATGTTRPEKPLVSATMTSATGGSGKPRILLVDDNRVNRLVATGMLKNLGTAVLGVESGSQALELLKRERFDLILMDCHMPEMDGLSTSEEIRAWEREQGRTPTPIIAVTADVHEEAEARCRAGGMDGYLAKPVSLDALSALLERWLPPAAQEEGTTGTSQASGSEPRGPRDAVAQSPSGGDEQPVLIDRSRIDSLRGLTGSGQESDLVNKVVGDYLGQLPHEMEELRNAVAADDAERVRFVAHNLKSASDLLGARILAKRFREMEEMARRKQLEDAAQQLQAIEGLIPAVEGALQHVLETPPPREPETETLNELPADGENQARILVVDDDPSFCLITSAALRKAGFTIEVASSGRDALAMVDTAQPELILLDALMEDIDGFEVCRRLMRNPRTRQIPILMVTALEDTESVNRAFRAGAAGFINKPLNYTLLIHRIRFQLRAARESMQLRESREQLAIAQRVARLGYWRLETGSGDFRLSDQLIELCDLSERPLPDTLEEFLALIHPEDRERVRRTIRSAIDRGALEPVEFRMVSRDRREIHFHQQLTSTTGGILLGTVQDVTRQHESERKIRKLAYSDDLTGLASRSYFQRHLEDTIEIAARHGERFSLLYLDLDSFKDINDTLGHDVGDELLKEVARRILKSLRKSDFAARLGGDEFCILVDDLSINYAAEVASRCLEEVNRPIQLGLQTFNPRVSIGIANYPGDGTDAATLLKAADSAMYEAKKAGKHRYAFYRPELTIRARERLEMEHQLRTALQEQQLELWYQPQISLSEERIVGVEALVRWRHPQRGLVSPGEFIGVAERIGLIQTLGQWVLEEACSRACAWKKAGLPDLRLAVNISPLHFRDPAIVEQVRQILERTGWPARQLELEVTEGVVQTETGNMQGFRRLKKLGVRIAIDDFGTGYSSLASLKKLPIDCLKVDQLFVRDLVREPESATLVGTIVALARALNLEVVAEGVETEEEIQVLTALGCDLVQGYRFSKAVPADEIPRLLRQRFTPSSRSSNVVPFDAPGKP